MSGDLMTAPKLTLYYSPGACSLAPHLVLEELGIPYGTQRVPIAEGAHLRPEYLAINPRARLPALAVGDTILTEAIAILRYLARLSPEPCLWPATALDEARTLSLMIWLTSTVHITFAQIWRAGRYSDHVEHHAGIQAKGRAEVARQLGEVEQFLGSADYAIGNRLTVADFYLLVFYRWGWRIKLDMAPFARWSAHTDRMAERPAVRRVIAREGIELRA